MVHELPSVLNNRFFPTLVCTAKSTSPNFQRFIVASIPIDLSAVPASKYSKRTDNDTIRGEYVSVERCELQYGGKTQWVTAAASDANGSLWMPVQKIAIPGKITKDVGLFAKWIKNKRTGQADNDMRGGDNTGGDGKPSVREKVKAFFHQRQNVIPP